jgi:hypothetical protein
VEVVNGDEGVLLVGFVSMDSTVNLRPFIPSKNVSTRAESSKLWSNSAFNAPFFALRLAIVLKKDVAIKPWISSSLSVINRTATD